MVVFKSLPLSLVSHQSELARRMNGVKVFGLVTLSIPLLAIVTHRYYYSKDKQMNKKSEQVHLQEQLQEQVITNVNVSWSELAPDLLGEIVSRLCLTDQARFLVVCKNWLAAAVATKSISSLPWLGRIVPGGPEFQIFDPLSSSTTPASVHNISWSNLGFPSPPLSTVGILSIQHNWLLLSFQKPRLFSNMTRRYSLAFNPLTKKVITLPGFDHQPGIKFTAAFSTLPDSPDCVYCMIDAYSTDKISVITYRNGDKQWTARQFDKVAGFLSCTVHPLILDGIIYIVSGYGQVASYNILSGKFNFDCLLSLGREFNFGCLSLDGLRVQINNARSNGRWKVQIDIAGSNRRWKVEINNENARSNRRWKVFVLNGEPMILYYDPDGTKDVTRPQCIKRYDRSRKIWIPATTLLGYTLFFGQKIFNVSLINTKGRRNNGVLPNKIYHFVNGGCHVYSLENGNLVRFKSINSNLLEDGGGELPEYKYNYDGIPDTYVISAYWLKTPCVHSSSDNQERKEYTANS